MAEITKLVPHIRYNAKPRYRNIKGPAGRMGKIRTILTALFQYERIQVHQFQGDEVRGYAERLITEAMRHGDQHPQTMELADYWLEDKNMIYKLFNVLAPRYQSYRTCFTDLHLIPHKFEQAATLKRAYFFQQAVLELKGNPYPPMPGKPPCNRQSATNLLLREAAKDYRKQKALDKGTDSSET